MGNPGQFAQGMPAATESRYPSLVINYKVHAGSLRGSVIHRTLTWTTGSSTCVRDHSYACVYTRGLGIPYRQRVSTTFLTRKKSHKFVFSVLLVTRRTNHFATYATRAAIITSLLTVHGFHPLYKKGSWLGDSVKCFAADLMICVETLHCNQINVILSVYNWLSSPVSLFFVCFCSFSTEILACQVDCLRS